jgi:hypothetical protein
MYKSSYHPGRRKVTPCDLSSSRIKTLFKQYFSQVTCSLVIYSSNLTKIMFKSCDLSSSRIKTLFKQYLSQVTCSLVIYSSNLTKIMFKSSYHPGRLKVTPCDLSSSRIKTLFKQYLVKLLFHWLYIQVTWLKYCLNRVTFVFQDKNSI